jgi:group I intron endonuclease
MITNLKNGKAYIGLSTKTFRYRMNGHKNKAKQFTNKPEKGCRALNAAIRKYGWLSFKKEVMYAGVPRHLLPAMETVMIRLYNTKAPNGYNLTWGGEESPMSDPDVQARAREVMNSTEVKNKRAKVFSGEQFLTRVSEASSSAWNGYTPERRAERADKMATAARDGWIPKREAKMAQMTDNKARRFWRISKRDSLSTMRRKVAKNPDRYEGRDPIGDLERWWGPSFDERNRG